MCPNAVVVRMTMSAFSAFEPVVRMTRDEYRAWAEQQLAGRFERVNGVVVAMAPERAVHNLRKALVWQVLRHAVQAANLPCDVYTDGMTVEVGDSDYEPDAVVHCGGRLPDDAVAVPDPLIIVEVLSPSTSATDRAWKLQEYFKLPSLRHYLIVWADKQQVAHHRRDDDGSIETRAVMAGEIRLEPPGITISVEDIYAA
jgi:Uma2 family endonuclease